MIPVDADDLAARAAAGDGQALDELLRLIQPSVLRRCGMMLAFRADAEEACQDALLQVARSVHTFEGRSAFTTWLHVVVSNCVRETYRSLRRRAVDATPAEVLAGRPDPRTTSVIAGARIDVLDAVERLEQHNPDLAAAFVLRDFADLEYNEVAERLGVSVSTARFRIHEARKFVRERLTDSATR
ncbi:RNA polymerase sigma factor [Lentzea flava]|uniref:RNA polymerase subunit sigma-24 n=1 Tax=Lentzea flava TaxID=103732 RepID=A0ABQ2V0Z4_9PSEU|nr:sigma-70 family RNA polymerase sigma factor [Lentzea flava]MCP2202913.1 RNA polymerase sigma-70 factor, ECF subfamily [Lentzea flava]GGU63069.1 RNA polymerase subunit sigma-24 [Lentzea flava]